MSPKAFTEQEKEIIRGKLMDAAEQFLSTTGVRKTTVEDIAKAAGISKGAFYSFYDSKEVLFWEALMREHMRMHEIINLYIKEHQASREGFIEMIGDMYSGFTEKPWILNLIEGDYEVLMRRIPQEMIVRNVEIDNATMKEFEKFLEGRIKTDPELISAVMRMLFLSVLHRKEIGREWTDAAFMLLIHALADYIFK
jgi:AcrR family transcriptional regulator